MGRNMAIVLAAGQGKRMNSKVQKQFLLLRGKPVLYYSLCAFQQCALIDEIILVTGNDMIDYCRDEIVNAYGFDKVTAILPGGKERYHSVYEGLKACEKTDIVFIHDGARMFVTEDIIERTYRKAAECGACVAGMPVKDTIKIAASDRSIDHTPDRSYVWMIQTPQTFRYDLVREAYDRLMAHEIPGITDDAMVVEQMLGQKVYLVEGSYENMKLTTPEDLDMAELILTRREK